MLVSASASLFSALLNGFGATFAGLVLFPLDLDLAIKRSFLASASCSLFTISCSMRYSSSSIKRRFAILSALFTSAMASLSALVMLLESR